MPSSTECANPLLLEWLREWLENARQHNSKGITTYKKAYDSMKACPIAFNHPSEAQQLHGLGPKLCERLTSRLKEHCAENGLPMPEVHEARKRSQAETTTAVPPPKRARKPKPYVPTLRSGPYAILLALSSRKEGSMQGLTKNEVIELAQPWCDSSFTAPSDPTKYFTAWNSMKTLLEKDLVFERGRPLRVYALTEDGCEVAKRIRSTGGLGEMQCGRDTDFSNQRSTRIAEEAGQHELQTRSTVTTSTNTVGSNSVHLRKCPSDSGEGFLELLSSSPHTAPDAQRPTVRTSARGILESSVGNDVQSCQNSTNHYSNIENAVFPPPFEPLVLEPSTFSVHLVLDTREVRAKQDRDYIQEELTRKGIRPIMRSLELGDALWIAKRHDTTVSGPQNDDTEEVVLDWIVERKRLDDLVGSLKDGRFHEQKFRLRKSGVKNVIYIIEEISLSAETASKFQEAVESAIASTQTVNGYFVKKTQKIDDTIRYLARMTVLLKSLYESKSINVIPSSVLTPQNYGPLLEHLRTKEPTTDYHISYRAFASLGSKSDFLTLRDVYLKMLMCTKGITGDKALEIQKKWKTPRKFVEALEQLGSTEQTDLLMRELGGLVGRKKIGKALSAKVAEVWGDDTRDE